MAGAAGSHGCEAAPATAGWGWAAPRAI